MFIKTNKIIVVHHKLFKADNHCHSAPDMQSCIQNSLLSDLLPGALARDIELRMNLGLSFYVYLYMCMYACHTLECNYFVCMQISLRVPYHFIAMCMVCVQ